MPSTTGSATPRARSRFATSWVFFGVSRRSSASETRPSRFASSAWTTAGAKRPPSRKAWATRSNGTSARSAPDTQRQRLTGFTGASRFWPSDSTRSTRSGRNGRTVAALSASPGRRSTLRYRTAGAPSSVATVASTISAAGAIAPEAWQLWQESAAMWRCR